MGYAVADALREVDRARSRVEKSLGSMMERKGILSPETLATLATLSSSSSSPSSTTSIMPVPRTPMMVETAAAGSRMQRTEPAVATAVTVPVARFQEVHTTLERSKSGVGVEDHLKKSADSLARAMSLRSEAEKIARGQGLSPSRGDRSMKMEEKGDVMFHDLPTIAGDNLFEETQRWLKTSNPFDARKSEAKKNNVDARMGGGGGGGGGGATKLSKVDRDLFLENSAQYTTGAILMSKPPVANTLESYPAAASPALSSRFIRTEQQPTNLLPMEALVAQGFMPDMSSPLPDLM